jgi:hypothetical protein
MLSPCSRFGSAAQRARGRQRPARRRRGRHVASEGSRTRWLPGLNAEVAAATVRGRASSTTIGPVQPRGTEHGDADRIKVRCMAMQRARELARYSATSFVSAAASVNSASQLLRARRRRARRPRGEHLEQLLHRLAKAASCREHARELDARVVTRADRCRALRGALVSLGPSLPTFANECLRSSARCARETAMSRGTCASSSPALSMLPAARKRLGGAQRLLAGRWDELAEELRRTCPSGTAP